MRDLANTESQLRCFPRPEAQVPVAGWLEAWQAQYPRADWQVDAQEEALSCLIPLLLCGEQSAQLVFHEHANRARANVPTALAAALRRIEREEESHERALQGLAASVCSPPDLHRRKRKAQAFYASLGRGANLAEQFSRIESLDSCVCRIMCALARGQRKTSHALYHLFDAIKADEARHVGVSRQYARRLGIGRAARARQRQLVGELIVELLQPEAELFEGLGVDADRLFAELTPGGRL